VPDDVPGPNTTKSSRVNIHGSTARERIPQATFTVLPNAGHAPMIDDPELVAGTILASTGVPIKPLLG
jgi:pimeloyl-ACP methyl ester carboxylesterase